MNQKNHENEKQYEIYWNEKRTLALQIANWAKNSTDYPAEAVTRFYGNTAEVTSLAELSSFSLSLLIPLP